MTENKHITRLLDSIRGEGFDLKLNWETKRWKGDQGAAAHYTVTDGPDGKKPGVRTFVVIDYDGDGYGLYAETDTMKITRDVEVICGLEEGTGNLVC